jgi:hypothetical protein
MGRGGGIKGRKRAASISIKCPAMARLAMPVSEARVVPWPPCRRSKSPGLLAPTRLARKILGAPQHHLHIDTSTPAMCGIFFSLSRHDYVSPDSNTETLLRNRGPDSFGTHRTAITSHFDNEENRSSGLHATFVSTVLSLRGTSLTEQPLKDHKTGSILCWNGEAWSVAGQAVSGSDSRAVFDALIDPLLTNSSSSETASLEHVVQVLSSIRGPYAFVFYDARNQLVFYGRDCLGRRSLLRKTDNALVLSSVCDNATGDNWAEVEADGLYVLDLKHATVTSLPVTTHIAHRRHGDVSLKGLYLVGKSEASRRSLNWPGHSFSDNEQSHRSRLGNTVRGCCWQDRCIPSQVPCTSCSACSRSCRCIEVHTGGPRSSNRHFVFWGLRLYRNRASGTRPPSGRTEYRSLERCFREPPRSCKPGSRPVPL